MRERDRIIIRVKEVNKQLSQSNNRNSLPCKAITLCGMSNKKGHNSKDEMEAEIEDLKSQLEGRDTEVKVSGSK